MSVEKSDTKPTLIELKMVRSSLIASMLPSSKGWEMQELTQETKDILKTKIAPLLTQHGRKLFLTRASLT